MSECEPRYPDVGIENTGDKATPSKHHISNLLLLSMFAIAARYSEEEAPPPSGNMWEAGLFYMVQARELLSTFFHTASSVLLVGRTRSGVSLTGICCSTYLDRVYHYSRPSTCQALLLLGLRELGLGMHIHPAILDFPDKLLISRTIFLRILGAWLALHW